MSNGDVIEEEGKIYDDGVNVAARMESLAEAGGISISGTTYDQVKNKVPWQYEYQGEQEEKNITGPGKGLSGCDRAQSSNLGIFFKRRHIPGSDVLWIVHPIQGLAWFPSLTIQYVVHIKKSHPR